MFYYQSCNVIGYATAILLSLQYKLVFEGLKGGKREEVQQEWMNGKVAVICATVSFGLGVNKANVR